VRITRRDRQPSTPVGPGTSRTPTGRLVVDALTGRMPAYVDTGLNIVHVDDVATGTCGLPTRAVGRRYYWEATT